MPLFVLFVFGAVIIGAGAMISPVWPTPQPRVGLGATFPLAIVTGGAVFYASLFGWDVLVIDYLLFALVTGILLTGSLSIGQTRAEARGEDITEHVEGWPGPQDLSFFAAVAVLCALPALLFPAPLGSDAQGYGYMALVTREGGTFDTFAPFYPQINYLYAPGFSTLTAYLSQQLNQSLLTVQFSVGAVLALLNVWLAYDFGGELRNKRLGRAMALAMLFSLGLLGALAHGHFPALMGLAFTQAFLIYAIRYWRHQHRLDFVSAGLLLGAVGVAQPGMAIVVGLGYLPWLATMWLGVPRPDRDTWLLMALGIPLIAFLATAPWLFDMAGMLGDFESPYTQSADNLAVMFQYHGLWIVGVVLLGAWLGWNERDPMAILAIGWLFFIFDFAVTGGIAALLPFVERFINPADIAWHGPIIPYTLLGGVGLLWLWDEYIAPRTGGLSYRGTYALSGGVILALVIFIVANLNGGASGTFKTLLGGPGSYTTHADFDAAWWLRENAGPEARILNYPVADAGGINGLPDGAWVPIIAERDSIYFPALPYAEAPGPEVAQTQSDLVAFWRDPADTANHDLLLEVGIDYVIVPAVVARTNPGDIAWRWRDPTDGALIPARSSLEDAAYLEPAYGADNGLPLVYRVQGADDLPDEEIDNETP